MADFCWLSVPGVDRRLLQGRITWRSNALSFNVPYILLSIMWLPLPAVLAVAAASALVICTFRVSPRNTLVQILFHLANAINSAFVAWFVYYAAKNASGQSLPSLAFAAMAYFAINTISVAAVLAICGTNRCSACGGISSGRGPIIRRRSARLTHLLCRGTPWTIHRPAGAALTYLLYCICKSYSRQVGGTP